MDNYNYMFYTYVRTSSLSACRVTLGVVRRDAAISAAGSLTLAGEGGVLHTGPLFLPLTKA